MQSTTSILSQHEETLAQPAGIPGQRFETWMSDLGDIMALVENSQVQSQYPLAVLRSRIFPSLWHRQYVLLKEHGRPQAFLNWAWLAETVSNRYAETQCHVEAEQWNQGPCLWFMEILGNSAYLPMLIQQLRGVVPRNTRAQWHEVQAVGGQTAHLRSALLWQDRPIAQQP